MTYGSQEKKKQSKTKLKETNYFTSPALDQDINQADNARDLANRIHEED